MEPKRQQDAQDRGQQRVSRSQHKNHRQPVRAEITRRPRQDQQCDHQDRPHRLEGGHHHKRGERHQEQLHDRRTIPVGGRQIRVK